MHTSIYFSAFEKLHTWLRDMQHICGEKNRILWYIACTLKFESTRHKALMSCNVFFTDWEK